MTTYQQLANEDISAGLSAHNVHSWAKEYSLNRRKEFCQQQALPYEVAIINVTGELNVGNIIRTASLCGAQKVHILGRRKFDSRGTVGAENYIDVRRVDLMESEVNIDIQSVVDYFDIKNLYPVFIEQHQDSYPLGRDTIGLADNWANRRHKTPCFIFGNEGRGVPTELIDMYDDHNKLVLHLNQRGVIRSYNVGSAAAIVLYQAMEYFCN